MKILRIKKYQWFPKFSFIASKQTECQDTRIYLKVKSKLKSVEKRRYKKSDKLSEPSNS